MNEQQPDTGGVRSLLPEPDQAHRRKAGGTHTHKPRCRCKPCQARARKQEALPESIGEGGGTSDPRGNVVNADELVIAPVPKKSTKYQRNIIAEWIKLRTLEPDITNLEIARRLGIHKQYLYSVINRATAEGWLKFDDPLARIEHEVIPKALNTISSSLDAGDKKMAIEVAKGAIFPTYRESKGVIQHGTQIAIALKIEMPDNLPAGAEKVIEGQIVGRPKVAIEG